ncbi:MAG: CDP-glycerol glycerophosphotransferase family protein [Bifidobacteriaceae bacterium]|jgi:hypothetical protein|nr:CDP-glycerol glycerophosphotransferase family protein [Bifidobacteriaceae bacterium]
MKKPHFLPDVPLTAAAWALGLPVLALNALAVATVIVGAAVPRRLPLAALAAGVCLLVGLLALRLRRRSEAPVALVGNYVLSRLALVSTVWVAVPDAARLTGLSAGAAIMAGALMVEPTVKAMTDQAFPYAAHFPGVRIRTAHLPADTAFWTNLVGTAVVTAAAVAVRWQGAAGSNWGLAACVTALACGVVALAAMVDMGIFVLQRLVFNAHLPGLWERLQPTFAVHWQAPKGSLHQLTMWLDHLKALGKPFFVLTRTRENFREVAAAFPDVPVLLRVGLDTVGDAVAPSLKSVFYVNTAILNDHMLRYAHLTHIQLNHGDSDKIASYSPVFRSYDKNFVAGQAAIDRFTAAGLATAPGFFVIVGRPQVAGVRPARGPLRDQTAPVALYAPTWAGNTADSFYSSLPEGPQVVQALLDRGCTVVFRPHPYWAKHHRTAAGREAVCKLLAEDAAATGRAHVYGPRAESELSVFDCFNLADLMVSDVSSVVGDYLYSDKPLVMMAVNTPVERFVEEFPVARAAYVVDGSRVAASLEDALDLAFGDDPLAVARRQLKAYYLGDIPADQYAGHFAKEAGRYV